MGNWELVYSPPFVSYEPGERLDRRDWLRVPLTTTPARIARATAHQGYIAFFR
jgi:hypothetical protein